MHTCITASSSSPAPSARFARPRCPAVCPGECEEGALVYAIPTPRKRPDVYTYRPLSEPCLLNMRLLLQFAPTPLLRGASPRQLPYATHSSPQAKLAGPVGTLRGQINCTNGIQPRGQALCARQVRRQTSCCKAIHCETHTYEHEKCIRNALEV